MRFTLAKALLVLGLFSFGQVSLFAQKGNKDYSQFNNVFSFKIIGHTIGYSFNYERIILDYGRFKTTNKIGFAYYGKRGNWPYDQHLLLPFSVNQMIQTKPGEFVELGIGMLFLSDFQRANPFFYDNAFIFRIGYRFQNSNKRFLANIGYTPCYGRIYHYSFRSCGSWSQILKVLVIGNKSQVF